MATRTSFGTSQSPEWQNGVLSLVTVPGPVFSTGTQSGQTMDTLCGRLTCPLRLCRRGFCLALFYFMLSLS